jgi:hypothetical protein
VAMTGRTDPLPTARKLTNTETSLDSHAGETG